VDIDNCLIVWRDVVSIESLGKHYQYSDSLSEICETFFFFILLPNIINSQKALNNICQTTQELFRSKTFEICYLHNSYTTIEC